jgi:hypothetical protein
MKINVNRTVALVVAGLAVAGGGGAALAAGTGEERQAFLADAADRLGVQPSELETALEEAAIARLQAAVEAGTLTEEQAEELEERIRSGNGPLLAGPGFGGPGLGHHGGGLRLHAIFDAAAEYLGLTEAELRTAREDGSSLADLAEEQGKSVAGLEQALLAAAKAELAAAVEDGSLTAAQRDELLDDLESRIGDIVAETGFGRFPHGGFPPPGAGDEADRSAAA